MSEILSLDNLDIIRAFAKIKVLIVGDLMLDQYWWGTVDRISPEAPVPVVKLDRVTMSAGGAANVAANVAGLGAEPLLIGTIGKDSDSRVLLEQLVSCGIGDDYLAKGDRPTSVKTRIVAHSQHVVRVDRERACPLSKDEELVITESIARAIRSADIVVLSDYAKGTLSNAVLRSTIAAAADRNIAILADPKGKDFSRYQGVSMITPNRREAMEACRLDDSVVDAVTMAGRQLITDLGLDAVVITEGDKGITLFERGSDPVNLKAVAHEIYDVTGAGDTVIACLAVGMAAGLPRYDAVRLANLAAGLVVEQVGTTAISVEDLVQKLHANAPDAHLTDAALYEAESLLHTSKGCRYT